MGFNFKFLGGVFRGELDQVGVSDEEKRGLFVAFAHDDNAYSSQGVKEVGVGEDEFPAKDVFFVLIGSDGVKTIEADGDAEVAPTKREAEAVGDDDA